MKKQSKTPDDQAKKPSPPTNRKTTSKEIKAPNKIGKYKITGILAQGGMGILYKAIHPTLKRPVVIKKLIYKRGNPELKERFKQEASVMMDLNHENIVRVFDHFTEGSNAYIVEEFIEGISLDQLLQKEGPLSLDKFIPILIETAKALEYIHLRGVVHRDIKPSNILLIQSSETSKTHAVTNQIKITDFGIAATRDNEVSTTNNTLTSAGTPLGSPLFMAPEQNEGNNTSHIDARADIYSLALLSYISLFADLPPRSRLQLRQTTLGLPGFLRSFIYKSLANNRRKRPKNLSSFIKKSTRFNRQILHTPGYGSHLSSSSQKNREPLFLKVSISMASILILILFLRFGIKPLFFQVVAANQWGGIDIVIPVEENYKLSSETIPTAMATRGSDLKTIPLKLKKSDLGFESRRIYLREGETVQVSITTPIGVFTEYKTISSFHNYNGQAKTVTSPRIANESAPIEIGFSVFDEESGDDITDLCNISLAVEDQWVLLRDIPSSERKEIFVNGKSFRFLLECSGYKELQLPVTIPSGRRFMVNRVHLQRVE